MLLGQFVAAKGETSLNGMLRPAKSSKFVCCYPSTQIRQPRSEIRLTLRFPPLARFKK